MGGKRGRRPPACCTHGTFPDSPRLALDIGGTSLRAALLEGGQIIRQPGGRPPKPSTLGAVIGAVLNLAAPFAAAAVAVGVACAGAVAAGRVTATAVRTFPGWTDVPLTDQIEARLNLPCTTLNDARAAWGESFMGAGQSGHVPSSWRGRRPPGSGPAAACQRHRSRAGHSGVPDRRWAVPGTRGAGSAPLAAPGRERWPASETGDQRAAQGRPRGGPSAFPTADIAPSRPITWPDLALGTAGRPVPAGLRPPAGARGAGPDPGAAPRARREPLTPCAAP